ncbi:MAG: filamentous hemagglutinin N-terminal domain-containing protein, partial [Nodosilinea sp.]
MGAVFPRIALLTSVTSMLMGSPAWAQSLIVPDDTLGAEGSQVVPNADGFPVELIQGGAVREQNLFHSFVEFNVDAGRGAYFVAPSDAINNIFSRVTGSNPSNIFGVLGTRAFDGSAIAADLFFITPTGIVFGATGILDVAGSFTATTADAIQFGDEGIFSATSPEAPSTLLTIDPSAYLFHQSNGSIVNRSIGPNNNGEFGLQVGDGESLTLLSPEIRFEDGRMRTNGGEIILGGIATPGIVEIMTERLSFPEETNKANISLIDSVIESIDESKIDIHSQNLFLDGSLIIAATFEDSDAGNINIYANSANIVNSSFVGSFSGAFATGSIGSILVEAENII